MAGADLVNYLTSLNSSQLEQIEIMTNPPAKYEASGNSGIINIKTKKQNSLDIAEVFLLLIAKVVTQGLMSLSTLTTEK